MRRRYLAFLAFLIAVGSVFFAPNVNAETEDPHILVYEASQDEEEVKLLEEKKIGEIRGRIEEALEDKVVSQEKVMNLLHDKEKKNRKKLLRQAEKSHDSLYTVEPASLQGDQSDYIYVVDEDALVYVIQDAKGQEIANALVSISYFDEEGKLVERHMSTTDGNVKGVAAFDAMKGTRYGLVDVTMEGYHGVTLLQDEMTGGETRIIRLAGEKQEAEVYVRGLDIDGRDLIHNDTNLTLIKDDDHTMPFSILLTKTKNAELPEQVELRSRTDGRLIYTFDHPSSYDKQSETYLYVGNENWVCQNGLLKEKDQLYLSYNGVEYSLDNVSVKNAVAVASFTTDRTMEVEGTGAQAKFEDASKFTNAFTLGLAPLSLKVSTGILPDGTYYIACSKSFDAISNKWSSLFDKASSPKSAEKVNGIMDAIVKAAGDSMDTAVDQAKVIHGKETTFLTDPFYGSVNADVSAMIKGGYNEKTKQFQGDAFIAFNFNFVAGRRTYMTVGFVPICFGAELVFNYNLKAGLALNADSIFPLSGVGIDSNRSRAWESHLAPGFKGYVCAGIRNAIGVDVVGSAGLDIAQIIRGGHEPDPKRPEPHNFIDFTANVSANIYFLMMSKSFKLWEREDPLRLDDNWEESKAAAAYAKLIDETPFRPLDLTIGEEAIEEKLFTDDKEEDILESYSYNIPTVNDPSDLKLLAEDTFIDNQIQMVSAKDTTALFRLISREGKTRLVYQLQDSETGEFENILHEVPMPEEDSVYEFAVTNQKNEQNKIPSGYVYIAAVTGDVESDDIEERAHSTNVVGLVIDIDEGKLIQSKLVAEAKEDAFYFGAVPAHGKDDLAVAYREAASCDDLDTFKNYMVGLDGERVLLSENVPVYTANKCNSLWNATFWTVDTSNTDENTLKLIGYNAEGKQRAYNEDDTDPDHILNNFRVSFDVSEFKECYPDADPVACIGSLFGKEYMIVGGKLYQLSCSAGGLEPMETKEMAAARYSDMVFDGSNGHYQMLTDYSAGTLFITSMKAVYDTDIETTQSIFKGNELEISYVIEETDHYGTFVTLHGPRTYLLKDLDAHKYTCGYNSHDLGLVLATNAYHDEEGSSNDIYVWEEKAGYGPELMKMYLDNHIVTKNQDYLKAYISYQNAGYGKVVETTIQVKDSSGTVLTQAKYDANTNTFTDLGDAVTYKYDALYPADQLTMPIWFAANPDWATNEEVEITVSLLNEKNEVMSEIKLDMNQPKVTLSGKQEVWEGEHYGIFDVSNKSLIAGQRPKLLLLANYDEGSKHDEVDPDHMFDTNLNLGSFSVGSGALLSSKDHSKINYNLSYSLEEIWTANQDTGLMSVKVYLVDGEGKLLSDNPVILKNPYYDKAKQQGEKDPGEKDPADPDHPHKKPKKCKMIRILKKILQLRHCKKLHKFNEAKIEKLIRDYEKLERIRMFEKKPGNLKGI